MASSIDFTTLALGTLIGIGCRKQLKSAGRIAAATVANLAGVAAGAAASVAKETSQSPEEEAAKKFLQGIDQQVASNSNVGGTNGN